MMNDSTDQHLEDDETASRIAESMRVIIVETSIVVVDLLLCMVMERS